MRSVFLFGMLVVLAFGSPARAQVYLPESAPVADRAAELLLYDFCLQLFDGQTVDEARLARLGDALQVQRRPIGWIAAHTETETVFAAWDADRQTCRITVFGAPGVGAAL